MPTRRRKHARYRYLVNDAAAQILSPIDRLPDIPVRNLHLKDSVIVNSVWTADEKDKFFTALARCGKGNLQQVSQRVGSKSLVEVVAYVGLLDEATAWRRNRAKWTRARVFDLADAPAAAEVDDEWLKLEEKCAFRMAREEEDGSEEEVDEEEDNGFDEDSIFDVDQANELATWYYISIASLSNA
jgi:hypothetical protein